jgi:hypothetical protein
MTTDDQAPLKGWSRERIRAHVTAVEVSPKAHFDPKCAICVEAKRLGLWKAEK